MTFEFHMNVILDILKELKYATHDISIFTYIFDVLIKSFMKLSPDCFLHVKK